MAGQSLNATFFALRRREKSGVLTGLTVAYLIGAALLLGGFLALNYQATAAVIGWYGQLLSSAASGVQPQIDPSSIPAGLAMFFLTLIPFLFFFYVLFAAYEAGCLRWMIRGESGGFMGLSLGADTWRVYLTYWIWFGLYMAFSMVFTILTMAVVGFGVAMAGNMDPGLAGGVPVLIVTLLRIVLMVFFAVRFAPAAATSIGLKRFAFFDAWKVSSGRFWALFGAFLLVYLLIVVVEIVVFGVVFVAIGFSAFQSGAADASQVFASLMTPQNLVILGVAYALFLVLSVMVYLMMYGINARAVIAAAEDGKITGVNAESLAQTFT